jgi:predicted phage-related endonuclease
MRITPKAEHGTKQWHLDRWRDELGNVVFGASDVPALMGESPYTTRMDLFVDKTVEPEPNEETWAMRRGNLMEHVWLAEGSRILGVDLFTPDVVYRDHRFAVSMDGVDDESSPTIGGEVKTTVKYAIDSADDLPPEWRWQGWTQMAVLNVPIFFIVFDRRQMLTVCELPRSQKHIDAIWQEAEDFALKIENGVVPDELSHQLTADQVASLYPASDSKIELDNDVESAIKELEIARQLKKMAEEQEKLAKDAIARALKDSTVGLLNGIPVVSWKESAGRESLDVKSLTADHPDLVKQYMKKGASFRTMRLLKGE